MNTKVKSLEDALRLYPSSLKVQALVGEDKYYIESVYLEDYSSGKTVVVLKLEGKFPDDIEPCKENVVENTTNTA